MLHHCLYLSSARRKFDDDALKDLLAVSRRNNEAAGVSGMLLHAGGNFNQYIEGDDDAVRTLFNRIKSDPRHAGVLIVSEGPVEERYFSDWSMGCRGLTAQDASAIGGFDMNRESLEQRLSPDAPRILVAMMRNFYASTHRYTNN
jgi:hypothetical protein